MRATIELQDRIDRSSNVQPSDVLTIKRALGEIGFYDTPSQGITPFPDEEMFSAIKRYQRVRGLTVDGIIKPGGETEEDLNRVLEDPEDSEISGRSPIIRCPECGAPHGGSKGKLCPQCTEKKNA